MERILCLSHILQFTLPALDEVDDVALLAGCCGLYMVGVASGGAHESVFGLDVLAGSASRVRARTATLSLANVRCLQLSTYQKSLRASSKLQWGISVWLALSGWMLENWCLLLCQGCQAWEIWVV